MKNITFAYNRMPYWIQFFLINMESLRIRLFRYSKNFKKFENEYKNNINKSSNLIFEKRDYDLIKFVQYAKDNITYYNKTLENINMDGISTFDITKIPIINKKIVKQNIGNIVNKKVRNSQIILAHTSGTSGAGLVFPTTIEAHQRQFAIWWRYRNEHKIHKNMWCAYFGGRAIISINRKRPPFWHYIYPTKQIMFSNYHLNEKTVFYYYEELEKCRPPWIHGYPSNIDLLAILFKKNKLQLSYKIQNISLGAENLLVKQKQNIEEVFEIKPIQHYGQAEGVANISLCRKGKLHVDEDYSFVEFHNVHENIYKIIGTNFTNYAFPLIRYDTGDFATINKESVCNCGNPGRVIDNIDGRNEDFIILADGTKIGRLDHIFKDMFNIEAARIIQKKIGAIKIQIYKGQHYTTDDERVLRKIAKDFLGDIQIDIEYVTAFGKSDSGKFKFVISEIEN